MGKRKKKMASSETVWVLRGREKVRALRGEGQSVGWEREQRARWFGQVRVWVRCGLLSVEWWALQWLADEGEKEQPME